MKSLYHESNKCSMALGGKVTIFNGLFIQIDALFPQWTYSTEVFLYPKSVTGNRITNRVQGKTEVYESLKRMVNVPSFYWFCNTQKKVNFVVTFLINLLLIDEDERR